MKMIDVRDTINRVKILEKDHAPDAFPSVPMQDLSILRRAVERAVPSIDLLEARMKSGAVIKHQDGRWCLCDGDIVCSGKTIREMLVNLIFVDC